MKYNFTANISGTADEIIEQVTDMLSTLTDKIERDTLTDENNFKNFYRVLAPEKGDVVITGQGYDVEITEP